MNRTNTHNKIVTIISVILSIVFLVTDSYALCPGHPEYPDCSTKYPIVLSYHWGGTVEGSFTLGMVEALRCSGAMVFIPDKYNYEIGSSYGTTAYRAKKLAQAIEKIIHDTRPANWNEAIHGKWKVNLIGHSQGAVDSRYMIAKLYASDGTPMHKLIATYTSLSGIHGGSPLADFLIWCRDSLTGDELNSNVKALLFPTYGRELSDSEVDEVLNDEGFWPSVECLTTSYMEDFNQEIVPIEQGLTDVVYRKSYASKIKTYPFFHWEEYGLLWLYIEMADNGGDNDFYITVEGQRFRETELITGEWWCNGLHHMAWSTEDMPKLYGNTGWDVISFYLNLVHTLKVDGF